MVGESELLGSVSRRAVIAGATTAGAAGVVGAGWYLTQDWEDTGSNLGLIGYARGDRDPPGGTSMADMPDLEGELTVYSGRGQFLVNELVDFIGNLYDDFTLVPRYGSSTDMVNQIINEGSGTPADVFYSVNAGSLGALTDAGRTQPLSSTVREMVRSEFRTNDWVGTSGRARTVPHNTDVVSADDLPDDIMAYRDLDADIGWAPGYGSAQAFITAMRILEGETATREWLRGITDNARSYPDEFTMCQAVAAGEVEMGFSNHYYIQRVIDGNPDAPLDTHFTSGDAGAVFNVAGAAIVDAADDATLADNFVRHLLSAEAQDYFARTTFEYPLIPEVDPIGGLPTIDELDVPDIDLTRLSDLEATVDMMREEGVEF